MRGKDSHLTCLPSQGRASPATMHRLMGAGESKQQHCEPGDALLGNLSRGELATRSTVVHPSTGFPTQLLSEASASPALVATSPDIFSPSDLLHSGSLCLPLKDQCQWPHLYFKTLHQKSLYSPHPLRMSSCSIVLPTLRVSSVVKP